MKKTIYIFLCVFGIMLNSCTKHEIEKRYVFGVDKVTIRQPGTEKPNTKTTTEFISICYSDLFGSSISNSTLVKLSNAYVAFGDKKLVEDIIIRNFLNSTAVIMPTTTEMRNDPEGFVENCYKKFFTRYPSEFEKHNMAQMIETDSEMTPDQVFYAFLTSNEYRYY